MEILNDLYKNITEDNYSLTDIMRVQQAYHEKRRWSVMEAIGDREIQNFSQYDRAALWHAARAEITTQPAGIRLAVQGVKLAREHEKTNPVAAKIFHAAASWSGRYWLEEEAHHEVAFGLLLEKAQMEPIPHDELIEHRGDFPEDNYARVLMLQAAVEMEASVTYGHCAKTATDPLVRDVFLNIMRDEVQHRQYFVSFAKALVQAGAYPVKDVLSMAYTWIRPNGETHGSTREKQEEREGFVNWWERVETEENTGIALADDQIRSKYLQDKKERSMFAAVKGATDITVNSIKELERAYYASLSTNDINVIQDKVDKVRNKAA